MDKAKQHLVAEEAIKQLEIEWWPCVVWLDMNWESHDPDQGDMTDEEINQWFLDNGYNIKCRYVDNGGTEYELKGPREDLESYIKKWYEVEDQFLAREIIGDIEPDINYGKPAATKMTAAEFKKMTSTLSDEDIEKYKDFDDILKRFTEIRNQ